MDRTCDTCAHKEMDSKDADGNRIVECGINEFQIFSPFAEECKHWEKAVGEK